MLRDFVIGVAVCVVCFTVLLQSPWAQDRSRHHEQHAEYQSWRQPGSGASCCSNQDCGPTQAEFRQGAWWAEVAGRMRQIPDDRILRQRSPDLSAHVCATTEGTILCFVPPPQGF